MANFCSHCGKPAESGADFCIHCGTTLSGKKPARREWQGKREKVLRQSSFARRVRLKPVFIAALFVGALVWVYVNMPEGGNPIIKSSPVIMQPATYAADGLQMYDVPASVREGKIIVPLDILAEKKLIAFNYAAPTGNIPLLAYVSDEGKIVTAVAMCEPCNSNRFHIRGEEIVCNSCGSTWKVKNLEAISGSCSKYPPDAVPNTVVANEIQIDEQTVAQWRRRI